MNVDRFLEDRVTQGFSRRVQDRLVLAHIASVLKDVEPDRWVAKAILAAEAELEFAGRDDAA